VPLELAVFSLAPWLISLVFSARWTPALVPLYLLCIHWAGANLTSPLFAALNAIGRPRTALILSAVWTASTLLLALLFVRFIGYVGFALAYAVTMVGAAAASTLLVNRAIHVRLWPEIRTPLTIALLVAAAVWAVVHLLPASIPVLVLSVVGMGLAYLGAMWLAEGPRLRSDFASFTGAARVGDDGD